MCPTGPLVSEASEIKYLGVYLDDTSSNAKHLRYRISQAVSAAKQLKPLMSHSSLPPSWKLQVYRAIVQAILLYSSESIQFTPSQLIHMDSIHYKQLRRIFKTKSSYYHRVLNPTDAQCSNQYLHDLAFSTLRVQPPSQLYSQQRLQLLDRILRHPHSLLSILVLFKVLTPIAVPLAPIAGVDPAFIGALLA